jgi:hypothetical protein
VEYISWRGRYRSIRNFFNYIRKFKYKFKEEEHESIPQVLAFQVKEKYGTLRFYYSTIIKTDFNVEPIVDKIISDVVTAAERRSAYICENTGKRGVSCSRMGWLRTLCKEEADKDGYIPTNPHDAKYWDELNSKKDDKIYNNNSLDEPISMALLYASIASLCLPSLKNIYSDKYSRLHT